VDAGDAAEALRIFQAQGAVHVRGALDIAVLARLQGAAADVFAEREVLAEAGELPDALSVDYTRRFIHLDHLATGSAIVDELLHPAFVAIASVYLGKDPEIADQVHVRSITPVRTDTYLPFHQDQTILRRRLLNVWIPLSACGRDAPGLELVLDSWRELFPVSPPPGAKFAVELARIDEQALAGGFEERARWRPSFEAGDAMLFAGATAHRTHATPDMTHDRMSVELRLV
jgi:hypothetical protein